MEEFIKVRHNNYLKACVLIGMSESVTNPDHISVHYGLSIEACAGRLHRGVPAEFELYLALSLLELKFT
jgi:hypothetical protein